MSNLFPSDPPNTLPAPVLRYLNQALMRAHHKGPNPRADIQARVKALSAHYRSGGTSAGIITTPHDALAYGLVRMPACHGAALRALWEIQRHAPDFLPASCLDVGAGPGTASFAARALWPQLALTLLEDNAALRTLAGEIFAAGEDAPAADGDKPPAPSFINGDFYRTLDGQPPHDLVLMTYALVECPPQKDCDLLASLWRATARYLVLVEPGTPRAYQRLMIVRKLLIEMGASILAPCPHQNACPLPVDDWCHFAIRVPRIKEHIAAKAGSLPFEDEPFCYLIATRGNIPSNSAHARIVRQPRHHKFGTRFDLCTANGLSERLVLKKDKGAFKASRKKNWGDAMEE